MDHTSTQLLADETLIPYLKAGDTVIFDGLADSYSEIHDQVVRLGFGDSYFVEVPKKSPPNYVKVFPKPNYEVNKDFYKDKRSKLANMKSKFGPK